MKFTMITEPVRIHPSAFYDYKFSYTKFNFNCQINFKEIKRG
jgi:hypothetical protein